MAKVRTCSEICIDADNHAGEPMYLDSLCQYLKDNIYEYPLIQLEFMVEHINNHRREYYKLVDEIMNDLFKQLGKV